MVLIKCTLDLCYKTPFKKLKSNRNLAFLALNSIHPTQKDKGWGALKATGGV